MNITLISHYFNFYITTNLLYKRAFYRLNACFIGSFTFFVLNLHKLIIN